VAFGFGKRPPQRRNPSDQTENYNTALTPSEETAFQAWRDSLPSDLQNTRDYDLRGAWKANAQAAGNGHLPDTWKKPNHITFSDGSIYASPQNPPGQWEQSPDQTWTYTAPPTFDRYHSADDILNYFQAFENGKREDGTYGAPNRVVLPKGRKFGFGR
jgi:hypothetical protein